MQKFCNELNWNLRVTLFDICTVTRDRFYQSFSNVSVNEFDWEGRKDMIAFFTIEHTMHIILASEKERLFYFFAFY